jgi:NADH-quinone oxidoreductase subunit J
MNSTSGIVLFAVTATLALLGAVGTVLAKRPLRGAVALLVHVMALAGMYLVLHAQFLAVIQMLVYAGAIVVLFVFVIMLIGPDAVEKGVSDRLLSPLMAVLAIGLPFLTIALVAMRFHVPVPVNDEAFGTVKGVGRVLFGDAVVPFELISVTLLVAIIGTIAVARGRTAKEADELRTTKAEREAQAIARKAKQTDAAQRGPA